MAGDVLSFVLLSLSSVIIIINPLGATLIYVSFTTTMDRPAREAIAKDACRFALIILLSVAVLGTWILQLFGITLEAFRIAGGILLFGIGMEMVYAKTSRTKLTATEKYESRDVEDVAIMPLAIPMIAGPGAITTTIVPDERSYYHYSCCHWCCIFFYHHIHRDYLCNDDEFRLYRKKDRTTGVPCDQSSPGNAAYRDRSSVCYQRHHSRLSNPCRGITGNFR